MVSLNRSIFLIVLVSGKVVGLACLDNVRNHFGLSRPTNRPLPNRKSIAFTTFLSMLSSVFKCEIYLTISFRIEGERFSNVRLALRFLARAFTNLGCGSIVRSDGSNSNVTTIVSPILLGDLSSMMVLMYNRQSPWYLTRVC